MSLSKLRILVVEDDPDARELMQAVLEQRGASVVTADGVARAFTFFSGERFDVVISDIAMPEEDGLTLVRRLRDLSPEEGGRTPAIAVSAYVASSDRVNALSAGFDRYLHKPVDFDELMNAIQSVISRSDKVSA